MSDAEKRALPPEWDDTNRMNFMFSQFKENRDVNTADWDSKMAFWSSLIIQNCEARNAVCFTLQGLNNAFRRKGMLPLGLAVVVHNMARCGKIQRESEFAANVDSGWLSWGVGLLLVKPLKWTFSALLGSSEVPLEESFVVLELVKKKAAELLNAYRSSAFSRRSLLSFQELYDLSSDFCADESTLCMALLQLQREKRVTVTLHEGEKIVKFSQPVSPISDVDIGIYQLQHSEKLLDKRMEALLLEADKCREEARAQLREGRKSQALRCLKSRRRVEKRADNLFAQLETIRSILDKVAQSQTDKMVLQAYQSGIAALRLSLKDVTVECAEKLVDQIQELCDIQDEANQTLAGLSGADEDMDELEEELKSLLAEDSVVDISGPLPEVPSTPLSPATEPGNHLPSVPQGLLNVTDEQLEEELNRLTLEDLDGEQRKTTPPTKKFEPAQ